MGHLRGRRGALVAAGALFAAALLMHPGSSLGGQPHNDGPIVTSAGQAPWSVVLVANTSGGEQQCSGSLIDLTHVLTAAHCVFDDGTGQLIAPSGFVINAGIASELPASVAVNVGALEVLRVAAVRVMPGYVYASDTAGVANDVAELTLATPATPTSTVQPIAVAPVGASPQPGATTSVYGWGQSTTGISDQNEHLLTQTVLQPWTCDSGVSARICTVSATADSCPGDSGSGVVAGGATPELVGVLSSTMYPSPAAKGECTGNDTTVSTDVTTEAASQWLAGADSVVLGPVAQTSTAFTFDHAQVGGTATCTQPQWSSADSVGFVFVDDVSGNVLVEGSTPSLSIPDTELGSSITCVAWASNGGGTTYAWASTETPSISGRSTLSLRLSIKNGEAFIGEAPSGVSLSMTITRATGGTVPLNTSPVQPGATVNLPKLPVGAYKVCLASAQWGIYDASMTCSSWTHDDVARNYITASATRAAKTGRVVVRLAALPPILGHAARVKLTYRSGRSRRTIRRTVRLRRRFSDTIRPGASARNLVLTVTVPTVRSSGARVVGATLTVRVR